MAWKILIAGVDRTSTIHQPSGVTIDLPFNERGTARFATKDSYIPGLRQEAVIYDKDGTTVIFGGVIFQRETRGEGRHTLIDCECADWTWYLDRMTIAGGVLTGTVTLKSVLEWLQTTYFAAYGLTLDPAQVTGPSATVDGFTWERKYASDVLRDLTGWSGGYVFYVLSDKTWGMALPSLATQTAPFTITDSNSNARLLEWQETSEFYATKVILRLPGTGVLTTIQSWTVDAAILAAGYVETIAPSHVAGAVSATVNGSAVTVGASGTQLIWDWTTHRVSGGSYAPVLDDVIALTYEAQYPFEVIADSGVTPPIELVETLEDMTEAGTAYALAVGKLGAAYQSPRTFEIGSVVDGLRAGQVIGINSTYRSAVVNAFITKVTINLLTNDTWAYRADATTGAYTASGLEFWRSLGGGVSSGAPVLLGGGGGGGPIAGAALTRTNDANVTLTLGGGHAEAVLLATSLAMGWTGTLAAARLNANVVQAVANDTNVTASIVAQTLTLGWAGTLAAARLNSNVVQAVANDTNVTGVISAQNLTLGWTGQLSVPRGGTGVNGIPAGYLPYGAGFSPLASSARLMFDGAALNAHGLNVTEGNATFAASAHPVTNYTSNLGSLNKKYLSLHAAELWVETLVAQNTMATIGGRILVAPTTTLTVDLPATATTITTKHNNLAIGDRVYMEANGRVEWMAITSGPSAGIESVSYHPLLGLTSHGEASDFQYGVTRNLDGTGVNQWFAGDAILNTGTTGDGFIDLYSTSGVLSGSGPTIVGNVRTGTAYNNIAPRWAIGNLRNQYGYGSTDVYGFAAGDPVGAHITAEDVNGLRMRHNATTYMHIDLVGNATFAGQVTIGTGRNQLSNSLGSPVVRLATPDGDGTNWGLVSGSTGLTISTGVNHDTYRVQNGAGAPTNGSVWMTLAGTPVAGSASVWYGPRLPVIAGQRYEWSFYGGVHRAGNLFARMEWFDNAGNSLGAADAATVVTAASAGGWTLAEWGRSGVVATAPAGATQVSPQAFQAHTAQANPFTFLMRLFFGEAQPGQVGLSPWAPGGQTLITGDSLATDLVSASTIRSSGATSLTAGTGFWLDATGTPTFRVGNPSNNMLEWDGTNITLKSAELTINSTGLSFNPATVSGNTTTAYKWTVASGTLGVFASDVPGTGDRVIDIRATGELNTAVPQAKLTASGTFASSATMRVAATSTTATANIDAITSITLTSALLDMQGPAQFTTDVTTPPTGSISKNATNGLGVRPVTGSTFDFAVTNAANTVYALLMPAGTNDIEFPGGVKVGVPTGGFKGAGTLNAQAIYDDNVLLTDWVFDLAYGLPQAPQERGGAGAGEDRAYPARIPRPAKRLYTIDEVKAVTQTERRLPWMPTAADFEEKRAAGWMITSLWQGQEQQQLYHAELAEQLKAMGARLAALEAGR